MSRVLVTGARGFIGRHTLAPLHAAGFEVHAVTGSRHEQLPVDEVQWHVANLLDRHAVVELCAKVRASHLLHLAWLTTPGVYWRSPLNLAWRQATVGLVERFRAEGGEHAVLAGSCAEYDWRYGYCREDLTPLQPSSLYGQAKHATHEAVRLFFDNDATLAWARIFHLFGPGEASQRLVPSVLNSLHSNTPVRCSHGRQWRDFLHVEDIATAMTLLVEQRATGTFNLAGGEPVQIRQLVSHLARSVRKEHLIVWGAIETSSDDPPLLIGDNRRLRDLGWRPRLDWRAGLDKVLVDRGLSR